MPALTHVDGICQAAALETTRGQDAPMETTRCGNHSDLQHTYNNSEVNVDIDPNSDRRKRRRTQSPRLNTDTIAMDLSVTPPGAPDLASSAPSQLERRHSPSQSEMIKLPLPLTPSKDELALPGLHEPTAQSKHSGCADSSLQVPRSKSPPERTCPGTRKIMKLRSDGKLGSPKSKRSAKYIILDAQRKSGEPNGKVVRFKYGTDEKSRQLIGAAIENIMIGLSPETRRLQTEKKRNETPKPTHPFFLGKPATLAEPSKPEVPGAFDQNDTQIRQKIANSPRKIPPNQPNLAVASWANFRALSSKTIGNSDMSKRKPLGADHPSFPPSDMMHIRGLSQEVVRYSSARAEHAVLARARKLKETETQCSDEHEVLRDLERICLEEEGKIMSGCPPPRVPESLRLPTRRTLTARQLQEMAQERLGCKVTDRSSLQGSVGGGLQSTVHSALLHANHQIPMSSTAFDKFTCETQDWVHKYAPRMAEQVLQAGQEVLLLRDWLKLHVIHSVDSIICEPPRVRDTSVAARKSTVKSRKKRKRLAELDGFILSSDDEADELSEINDANRASPNRVLGELMKRSVIRQGDVTNSSAVSTDSKRPINAVIISGPHGCGKSAAVYAVARELDFEVFEINSGSRRSGKDILDKVGDMSRNHLVNRKAKPDDPNTKGNQDLDHKPQPVMSAFLKPNLQNGSKQKLSGSTPKSTGGPKLQKPQKQSVILLEDVDILFDEDRAFWTTTMELIVQSRRPIIMTCTDESLLPVEDMALYAIFRLSPPPTLLATDYLLLVAANEGHLLSQDAVSTLYKARRRDLRASLTELNFYCQMAIGDPKGGLDWMLIKPAATRASSDEAPLRIVSEDTYLEGMGFLGHETPLSKRHLLLEGCTEILHETSTSWGFNIDDFVISPQKTPSDGDKRIGTRTSLLNATCSFERSSDALSAADIIPNLAGREDILNVFDWCRPEIPEKARMDFIEGYSLIQADSLEDMTGLSSRIALALQAGSQKLHFDDSPEASHVILEERQISRALAEKAGETQSPTHWSKNRLAAVLGWPAGNRRSSLREPEIASIDNTSVSIAEDTAPYVRSIISYDLQLEEKRLQLSSLLAQGGRNGKRIRTTRASRAALEGGSKAQTRAERWFPPGTNYPLILQTAGKGWQEAVWSVYKENLEDCHTDHGNSVISSSAESC
ncbi:hypothetical protein MMC09_004181 [Bachmanniomyces sp. S44760]|nr:hypothetical protein [Bachmanniomyces sp. S44760]